MAGPMLAPNQPLVNKHIQSPSNRPATATEITFEFRFRRNSITGLKTIPANEFPHVLSQTCIFGEASSGHRSHPLQQQGINQNLALTETHDIYIITLCASYVNSNIYNTSRILI